jgi:NAD(P)-dependent dehydrogenase (short-subunit alcohol dehydrogenase family)
VAGDLPLEGKRALVSGASRGIGRAIALGLADGGCHVAGLARSGDALAELGREVEARGRSFLPVELDLARSPRGRSAPGPGGTGSTSSSTQPA